jgi:hypothetical protein
MSSQAALQIADEMVDVINAETFAVPLTAERLYTVANDLRDLKTIKVSIVPKSVATARTGRGFQTATIEIDLAVQRTAADAEQCDALMTIADQVAALFEFVDLPSDFAKNTATERKFIYDAEGLETKKLFTALTTLTYEYHYE